MTKNFIVFLLFFILLQPMEVLEAQSQVPKSTEALFEQRTNQTGLERIHTNLMIARVHHAANSDSIFFYIDLLESAITENYDARTDAFIRKFKALKAFENHKSAACLELCEESLSLFTELKDYKEMGWVCDLMTRTLFQLGDMVNATDKCQLALEYFEKANSPLGLAEAYNKLGRINNKRGYQDLAMENYDRALELFLNEGEDFRALKIYNNLGILYVENGEPARALSTFKFALKGYIESNDLVKQAYLYNNIALCHDDLGRVDSALFYTRRGMNLANSTGDIQGRIVGCINIGYYLRLKSHYDSSIILFNDALRLAQEYQFVNLTEAVYKEYEDLYLDMQDFEKAYYNRIKYDSVQQEILSKEAQQRIEELNNSYSRRMEDRELQQLRAERKSQAMLSKVLLLILSIFLALFALLINGYRQKRKQRRLLSEKNVLLEKFNERLQISEKELTQLIEDKNKIFSIIAHDLRNPIAAVAGFTELLTENYNDLNDLRRVEYLDHILKGSYRSMTLLENLLLWARSQMNMIEIKKEELNLKDLLSSSSESLLSSFKQKKLSFKIEISNDFVLIADNDMMKSVIRNLLSNAMKFSFPGGKVILSAFSSESQNCIAVIDSGTGIKKEIVEKLFSSRNISSTEGTNRESGSGLGLVIARDFTEKNGGTIIVDSTPGKGSTFTLCFPIAK